MSDEQRGLTVAGENGVVGDFGVRAVVTVDQAIARVKELQKFVAAVMVKGEDYGIIPGTGTKPTLLKPGAEKLCEMYGLVPTLEIMDSIKDWEQGFFYYEVKCLLIAKASGRVVAEGVGSCNSRERRYKNQDPYTIANTILKMAKKRAHVDATLSATRSSGSFTQDVEDMDIATDDEAPRRQTPQQPAPANPPQSPPNLEKRYRELSEKADALSIPHESYSPRWSVPELTRKGKVLLEMVQEKELAAMGAQN